MKNLKLVKSYGKPYKKNMIWGIVLSVVSTIFVLLLPQITQLFIDSVYSFTDTDTGSLGVFWFSFVSLFGNLTTAQIILILSIAFVLSAILKNICSLFASQNFYKVSSDACGDIRKDCFKKLAFADKNISTNEVFFNFTNDISNLYQVYYKIFPQIVVYPLLIIFTSSLCFVINWKITLCFILIVPIMLFVCLKTKNKLVKIFYDSRSRLSEMVRVGEELIHEIREIKAFGNEDWATEKYNKYNLNHSNITKESNNYLHKCNLLLNMLRVFGILIAVILSAILCFNGQISIGYFVLFVSYALILFNTTVDLINNFYNFEINYVGIDRLNKLFNAKSSIKENKFLCAENPTIKLKNVGVVLNGKEVFSKLNYNFKFGTHYGIFIKQGDGKTAFARMLLRFVGISKGDIFFNNEPYENYNIASLRSQISYITQEPFIFEGTFADNITMFEEVDMEKLKKVVKICELSSLINKNCKFELVENGANVPAQERQKINIARALYRNAPILLIDNAFNKFTTTFTAKILKKIKNYYKDKTIIFLSDKPNELQEFETILKIQNGILEANNEEK